MTAGFSVIKRKSEVFWCEGARDWTQKGVGPEAGTEWRLGVTRSETGRALSRPWDIGKLEFIVPLHVIPTHSGSEAVMVLV